MGERAGGRLRNRVERASSRTMSRGVKALLLGSLGLVMAMRVAGAAELRASKPEVRREIVATIEGQLAAFRKNESAQAYRLAAAELRAQRPLAAFVEIVRRNYPEIWANTKAEFGIVRDDGARATVTVQVYSKDTDAGYDYALVKEPAGWRIHGVLRHAPKPEKKV